MAEADPVDDAVRAAADRFVGDLLDTPSHDHARLLDALRQRDPSLFALVDSLLAHVDRVDAFLEQPIDARRHDDRVFHDAHFGRWNVVRPIGRGGMGVVFEVERGDGVVRQRAALKRIERSGDDESIAARFRTERQILAGLEHPNIARLIDAGASADGRSYLVMEYVDGVPLDAWCARQGSTLEQRIVLFSAVCDAVHYAHQRLVVHRDLKPNNILVTADGTPKLLDFGISKLLDGEASRALTVDASTLLTPRYASPEQLTGGPISTTSDVYSLGVLLFELLTGTLPYRTRNDSLVEMMRVVMTEPPGRASAAATRPPPSGIAADDRRPTDDGRRLARRLRGDLDHVLMKALAKDPAERYVSAAALRDDLARHLAGDPIEAVSPTWTYRADKFVRKHRVAVAFAMAITVAIVALGAIASREAVRADRARAVAERERSAAERRFEDTRTLAKALLFDLNDAIATGPTKAREQLVRTALVYLDRLSQERLSPDLQRDVASGYERISQILGNATNSNLGRPDEAKSYLLKALEIRERLMRDEPDHRDNLAGLVSVNRNLGSLLRTSPELAAPYYAAATKAAIAYAAGLPDDVKPMLDVFNRRADEITILYSPSVPHLHRYDEALAASRRLLADIDSYGESHPDALRYPNALERTLYDLAALERQGGDLEAALRTTRRTLAVFERHVEQQPDNPVARRGLAIALRTLGEITIDLGLGAEGLAALQRSVDLREAILAADPANVRAERDLGSGHSMLAFSQDLAGRPREALLGYERWVSHAEHVLAKDPNRTHRWDLETARWSVADMHLALGQPGTALAEAKRVEAEVVVADGPEPSDDRALEVLANARLVAGRSLAAAGRPDAGFALATRALADLARVRERNPSDAVAARELGRARIQTGDLGLSGGPALHAAACALVAQGADDLAGLRVAHRLGVPYLRYVAQGEVAGARCATARSPKTR